MKKSQSVFTIVFLVGLYVTCQLIADIGATKLVEIWGIVLPGGTFVFAITFTLRDLIHKSLGVQWARASIWVAGLSNLFLSGYLASIALLPSPPFYGFSEWNGIFSIVPAITLGSILAELISELIDTEVYSFWKKKFSHFPQWTRVLVSNGISLPIDSFVFALFGFVLLPHLLGGTPLGFGVAWGIVSGQIIFKGIITLVSLPLIYITPEMEG